jgi:hypothetical protein
MKLSDQLINLRSDLVQEYGISIEFQNRLGMAYNAAIDFEFEVKNEETLVSSVCPICDGKGEFIDIHPERYGIYECKCKGKQ